ncbi:hypothetical protein [Streptomyces sp. NPDC090080]|uniref:hypothetical protein n=1 Tax=Streptomyces sp. NPDC090080 TaxID=3365939 RepID=UPI0038044CC9
MNTAPAVGAVAATRGISPPVRTVVVGALLFGAVAVPYGTPGARRGRDARSGRGGHDRSPEESGPLGGCRREPGRGKGRALGARTAVGPRYPDRQPAPDRRP